VQLSLDGPLLTYSMRRFDDGFTQEVLELTEYS